MSQSHDGIRGEVHRSVQVKHYEMGEWVDFARALAPEPDRIAMQHHLAEGCAECRPVAEFYDRLSAVCQGMVGYEVPESVARLARAIFPVQRTRRWMQIPAELIFDSFLAPSPIGMRTTWQVGWQALYRAGDCSVDLRVEPDLTSSRAAVIGQISNHVSPEVEMSGIPVCLKQGKLVLAEAVCNRFGEFQMEYDQQARIQLCIDLEGDKRIQVPIKRLATEKRPASGRIKSGLSNS